VTLQKMTPGCAAQDGLDGRVAYAIFPSQLWARHSLSRMVLRCPARGANFAYLLLSQLRFVVCLANWTKSVLVGMFYIAALGHPFKILNTVISLVSILVVSHIAIWRGANKGCKNQAVDARLTVVAMPNKRYGVIGSFVSRRIGGEHLLSTKIADMSLVTDFIPALVANNLPPNLHTCSIAHIGKWGIVPRLR